MSLFGLHQRLPEEQQQVSSLSVHLHLGHPPKLRAYGYLQLQGVFTRSYLHVRQKK
jgi:hypothetical protein